MRLLSFFSLLLSVCSAFSQVDTVFLDSVQISNRYVDLKNNINVNLDSTLDFTPSNNLAEILTSNTTIQINEYGGKGNTASISVRGLSAYHTQVNWNGLPINSPNLGMFNAALVNTYDINSAKVSIGSSSSSYGSGAIGGVIELNSKPVFNQFFNTSLAIEKGSFGKEFYGVKGGYSNNKLFVNLGFNNEFVRNDFKYNNTFKIGKPEEKLKNAEFWNQSFNLNFAYRSKWGVFKVDAIHQNTLKNVPAPLSVVTNTESSIKDSLQRVSISHTKVFKASKISTTYGYLNSFFRYINGSLISELESLQQFGNIEYVYCTSRYGSVKFYSQNQWLKVNTGNYSFTPKSFRSYQKLAHHLTFKKLETDIGVGVQTSEYINPVPVYYSKLNFKILKALKIYGSVSKHFRVPSFNELYWNPGGNINLNPESGLAYEGGIALLVGRPNFKIKTQLNPYYLNITNWIQWVSVGSYWQPENYKHVVAKGVDLNLNVDYQIGKIQAGLVSLLNFSSTINKNHELVEFTDKQLPLTPKVKTNSTIYLVFKKTKLSILHAFTGERFTSSDNNSSSVLPFFNVWGVQLQNKIVLKKTAWFLSFKVNNLLDEEYEVVQSFPMPGRSYSISLKTNISQLKFKK